MNSKWMIDINAKLKNIKVLEENINHFLIVSSICLRYDTKKKFIKLTSKSKISSLEKDTIGRIKIQSKD